MKKTFLTFLLILALCVSFSGQVFGYEILDDTMVISFNDHQIVFNARAMSDGWHTLSSSPVSASTPVSYSGPDGTANGVVYYSWYFQQRVQVSNGRFVSANNPSFYVTNASYSGDHGAAFVGLNSFSTSYQIYSNGSAIQARCDYTMRARVVNNLGGYNDLTSSSKIAQYSFLVS